jgi:hypothetical protein
MMEAASEKSDPPGWTYTEVFVYDEDRTLRPTHICSDEISFASPPELRSTEIRIRITNGPRETNRTASVLPHAPGSTDIPIKLLAGEVIQAKRTA